MFSRLSIKQVVFIGFMVVIVASTAVAISTVVNLFQVNARADTMVADIQPSIVASLDITGELNAAVASLGFYLLSQEGSHKDNYQRAMADVERLLGTLRQQLAQDPDSARLTEAIAADVARFRGYEERMLALAVNPDQNMPALAFSAREIYPLNKLFQQNITQMILSEREQPPSTERAPLLATMNELRYVWGNLANTVRAYLAFRGKSTLDEIAMFRQSVTERFRELHGYTALLTLDQEDSLSQLDKVVQDYLKRVDEMVAIHGSDKWRTDAYLVRTEIGPLALDIEGKLRALVERQHQRMETMGGKLLEDTRQSSELVVGGAVFVALLGLIVMLVTSRRIAGLINIMCDGFLRVARGDLTTQLPADAPGEMGEIGRAFNAFVVNLHDTIYRVAHVNEQVSSSAAEIYMNADATARDTARQSEQIGEMASAMTQMSSSIADMAQNSVSVSTAAQRAAELASSGKEMVTRAMNGMEAIRATSESSARIIGGLGEKSAQIGAIAQVITEIADQTNLLALNAAIEAARAGEQGRGFAVVADEVRSLAEKTNRATQQITEMIKAIQGGTDQSVAAMNQAANGVSDGVQIIFKAGDVLREIVGTSEMVAERIMAIASSIEEQSATAEQLTGNIDEVAKVAHHLADNGARNATVAQELSHELASELEAVMKQFRLNVQHGAAGGDDVETQIRSVPSLVQWDASFSVGVPSMDEQHFELVDLVNRLNGAMKKRLGDRVVGEVLDRLVEYTKVHFRDEEALMARGGFQDQAHLKAHRDFIAEVGVVYERFKRGEAGIGLKVLNFLSEWLVNHIKKTDKQYSTRLARQQA